MDQRLCVSFVTGTEYFKYTMSAIMNGYIRFFNDPIKFEYQRKNYKRYKQKKGKEPMGLIDVNLIERDEEDRGDAVIEKTEAGYEI